MLDLRQKNFANCFLLALGVVVVANGFPPVAPEYHFRLVPVALKLLMVLPAQTDWLVATGAVGSSEITTSILALMLSQPAVVACATQ